LGPVPKNNWIGGKVKIDLESGIKRIYENNNAEETIKSQGSNKYTLFFSKALDFDPSNADNDFIDDRYGYPVKHWFWGAY
jgi:hypothetical protein